MKFAIIKVNGHYRASFNYEVIRVMTDDFTRGGQRIELYADSRLIAVVYGRIDHNEKFSNIEETVIEIAE